jgi:hypothetical protein
MSYDIRLVEPNTGETIHIDSPHYIRGGNYAIGGTTELWMNVTYNYAPIFKRVLGEEGVRSIYGTTGEESVPILKAAIMQLKDDASADYWEATDGNAKKALSGLLSFARMRPDGIWEGD